LRVSERPDGDPRVYMAAERTFLAWIRTGVALMGFGFVVARFGLFLREVAALGQPPATGGPAPSLVLGLALVVLGVLVNAIAAVRHRAYVAAIDGGRFRSAFGSGYAVSIAVLLTLVGVAMAVYLARL
jgi:putative membrane protein